MRQHISEPGTSAKTWGPFTGRQLTTILCVLIVTVLFPVTAWAVSGTSVFVTDKATGKTAAVDANRNLQTKVNGTVTVNGSTSGNVAPAASFVQSAEIQLSGTFVPVFTPAAGKEIIVTQINNDWSGDNLATASYSDVALADPGTCANPSPDYQYFFDLPTGAGNIPTSITPGLIVPHGKSLCALRSGTSNPSVYFSAFGYTLPAGTVSLPAATLAAGAHATRR